MEQAKVVLITVKGETARRRACNSRTVISGNAQSVSFSIHGKFSGFLRIM